MRPRIFHLHIRKTAGTTLFHCLKRSFEESEICPFRSDLEYYSKIPEESWKSEINQFNLISGHFYHVTSLLTDHYARITFLRNPYTRIVSAYNHMKNDERDPLHTKIHQLAFEDALKTPVFAKELWNGQTRALVSASGNNYEKLKDKDRIECAIEILTDFDFVGIQEFFNLSYFLLCKKFKLPYQHPSVVNDQITLKGIAKSYIYKYSTLCAKTNRLDCVVYNAAISLLNKQIEKFLSLEVSQD